MVIGTDLAMPTTHSIDLTRKVNLFFHSELSTNEICCPENLSVGPCAEGKADGEFQKSIAYGMNITTSVNKYAKIKAISAEAM